MDTQDTISLTPPAAVPGPAAMPAPAAVPAPAVASAPIGAAVETSCDTCGAPVEASQRYCVVCGTHRRHANDPAERYLRRAASRARAVTVSETTVTGALPPARSSLRGIALALTLALIPAAAAAGVLAGRSSNSGDAALIRALGHRSGEVITVQSAGGSSAVSPTSVAQTATQGRRNRRGATRARASAQGTHRVVAATRYGSVGQVTGFHATAADAAQGAKVTQQVQHSKGKAYVGAQNSLPSQVVVP